MRKLKIVFRGEKKTAPMMRSPTLANRHLVSLHDLTPQEIDFLLDLGQEVKAVPMRYNDALAGRTLAMILQKTGLRTRVTFELAMDELGGRAISLIPEEIGLCRGEAVKDVARNRGGARHHSRAIRTRRDYRCAIHVQPPNPYGRQCG